jgi:hypothetical protein
MDSAWTTGKRLVALSVLTGILWILIIKLIIDKPHKPPFFPILMTLLWTGFIVLQVISKQTQKNAQKKATAQKGLASQLVLKGDFREAIIIWKKLILKNVDEKDVRSLLKEIRQAYVNTKMDAGLSQLDDVEKLYSDFFEMLKNAKELVSQPNGKAIFKSLVDKITEKVNVLPLPEQNGS